MSEITKLYMGLAALDQIGVFMLRAGLVILLVWIGALKFAKYEAEGIVPLVSNSPLMGFFYRYAAPAYRSHMHKEGELDLPDRAWNTINRTYSFSHGLGAVILLIGVMIALNPVLPQVAAIGSLLLALMSCTTLSFLLTTPEAWVPAEGDTTHGFHNGEFCSRLRLPAARISIDEAFHEQLFRSLCG
jgi:uncharacterized membrane protein YkgB